MTFFSFLLFLVCFCISLHSMTINITANPNLVGSDKIFFRITLNNANLSNNTYIQLQFPDDFSLRTDISFYCSTSLLGIGVLVSPTCSLSNSKNSIIISGGPYDPKLVVFSIGLFVHNGQTNNTGNFLFTFYEDGSQQYLLTTQVQLVPLNLDGNVQNIMNLILFFKF